MEKGEGIRGRRVQGERTRTNRSKWQLETDEEGSTLRENYYRKNPDGGRKEAIEEGRIEEG